MIASQHEPDGSGGPPSQLLVEVSLDQVRKCLKLSRRYQTVARQIILGSVSLLGWNQVRRSVTFRFGFRFPGRHTRDSAGREGDRVRWLLHMCTAAPKIDLQVIDHNDENRHLLTMSQTDPSWLWS